MKHDQRLGDRGRLLDRRTEVQLTFWRGLLNDRALTAMERVRQTSLSFRQGSVGEAHGLLASARSALTLADETAIGRMIEKNPSIVQIASGPTGAPAALLAFLPLNDFGAAMLVRGLADPARPDPAWITRPGETPAAVYVWLFFGPGQNIKCLAGMGEVFRRACGGQTTVFSRGATDLSERMQLKFGVMRATTIYPEAPEWLLVAVPPRRAPRLERPERTISVRPIESLEGLAQVIAIRSATYIAEQFPLYAEEFDGNDLCATHLIAYINGDPAGAVRVRYFADFAKVERLAVKKEYRRSRTAFALCRASFNHARRKGFTRIYGHASDEVAPLWRHMGARPLPGRPPFRFANIEYREMVADLAQDPLAIRFGADPMVTIRPEGYWDEPSALDWSNVDVDPQRLRLLKQNARSAAA